MKAGDLIKKMERHSNKKPILMDYFAKSILGILAVVYFTAIGLTWAFQQIGYVNADYIFVISIASSLPASLIVAGHNYLIDMKKWKIKSDRWAKKIVKEWNKDKPREHRSKKEK